MVNQYRLEEDEEEQQDPDTKDLFVSVDNPESHVTAIETFIMYRVVTKVRRSFCKFWVMNILSYNFDHWSPWVKAVYQIS